MKYFAGVLTIALLAGCQTYQEGAQMGVRVNDPTAPNARIQYDQVVILDKRLQSAEAGKIAVEQQGARRTETGTLKVIAVLRNRTDFPQVLEARTNFFDSGFAPAEKPAAWKRVHLAPNSIATYEEMSLGTQSVAHYYVEIREAR
ncbi:MAG TPA: hypothetical protein VIM12_11830 [Noviherbaspirillum sp.]|jgi:hypothetical protein|uniref:hypothetical protein n=1 Tax=Noviherbaspirillum sp. TaxID=1926288 RepID=UPI002F9288EA